VCITTKQPDTNANPDPNPKTKQNAVVSIQLNIVTCPTYPAKFIRDMLLQRFHYFALLYLSCKYACERIRSFVTERWRLVLFDRLFDILLTTFFCESVHLDVFIVPCVQGEPPKKKLKKSFTKSLIGLGFFSPNLRVKKHSNKLSVGIVNTLFAVLFNLFWGMSSRLSV